MQVKSYLAGNPAIRLALNDDLLIGRQDSAARGAWGSGGTLDLVQLDDCNFHESVSLDRFEAERMLQLVPPDGEFALMQYRCALPVPSPTERVFFGTDFNCLVAPRLSGRALTQLLHVWQR